MIIELEAGTSPGNGDFKTSERHLGTVYDKLMKHEEENLIGSVTKEGVRTSQRKWLNYREAWAKLGKARYPKVPADKLKTWATNNRAAQLAELLDEL